MKVVKRFLVFMLFLFCIGVTDVFAVPLESEYICPLNGVSFYIKYDTNGGESIDSIGVGGFNSNEELPVPNKERYIFGGWYYDEALTNKVIGTILSDVKHGEGTNDEHGCFVAPGVTLYAKWDAEPPHIDGGSYIISYVTNGGNAIENSSVCIGCAGHMYKLPIPVRKGYRFEGWYLDEALTQKVDGEYIDDVDGTLHSIVTIYAKWNAVSGEDNPHTGYFLNYFAIAGILIVVISLYISVRNSNKFKKI